MLRFGVVVPLIPVKEAIMKKARTKNDELRMTCCPTGAAGANAELQNRICCGTGSGLEIADRRRPGSLSGRAALARLVGHGRRFRGSGFCDAVFEAQPKRVFAE